MVVRLGSDMLNHFRRVSLSNSPYVSHREGSAVDLYPGRDWVPSPVAGTVVRSEQFRTPERVGTARFDTLLLIDTGDAVARMLHVEPTVKPGDDVAVGDRLGRPVRTGFFDPWVSPHVHLEFRRHEGDIRRPRGGVPIDLDVDPTSLSWDGRGRVVELGPEYAVLDRPRRQESIDGFAGIATADGAVLDGGMPHYGHGALFGGSDDAVRLLGTRVGTIEQTPDRRARRVQWEAVRVTVDDTPITGLSFVLAGDGTFGARLIRPPPLSLGDRVRVSIEEEAEDNAEERR